MIAGFGLLPFEPGGMVVAPVAAWLLLLGTVALASAFLWWTGRDVRESHRRLPLGHKS